MKKLIMAIGLLILAALQIACSTQGTNQLTDEPEYAQSLISEQAVKEASDVFSYYLGYNVAKRSGMPAFDKQMIEAVITGNTEAYLFSKEEIEEAKRRKAIGAMTESDVRILSYVAATVVVMKAQEKSMNIALAGFIEGLDDGTENAPMRYEQENLIDAITTVALRTMIDVMSGHTTEEFNAATDEERAKILMALALKQSCESGSELCQCLKPQLSAALEEEMKGQSGKADFIYEFIQCLTEEKVALTEMITTLCYTMENAPYKGPLSALSIESLAQQYPEREQYCGCINSLLSDELGKRFDVFALIMGKPGMIEEYRACVLTEPEATCQLRYMNARTEFDLFAEEACGLHPSERWLH